MSIKDIFNVNSVKSLLDVVIQDGRGFMMPDYQRPYRWSEENIERLISDLVDGVRRSYKNSKEPLFLGTLILVQAQNSELTAYLGKSDTYAQPGGIYYVVDGQQRLSTFAILAIILHREIKKILSKLDEKGLYADDQSLYESMKEVINSQILKSLEKFYSIHFSGSANPAQKPLILRKSLEFWVKTGSKEYTSPIAKYIADYIETGIEVDYPRGDDRYNQIQRNQKKIMQELNDKLLETDSLKYDSDQNENQVLIEIANSVFSQYYSGELKYILQEQYLNTDVNITHLLKYVVFTQFFCNYCCVNYLEPKTHQWAIEVFQSLNSTGVPLSALEVFKAYVYEHENLLNLHSKQVKEVFESIEEQMISENENMTQRKTDVFLTALALGFNGVKLGTRYTQQEKYLKDTFKDHASSNPVDKSKAIVEVNPNSIPMFEYMTHLSNYMQFWYSPESQFTECSRTDVQSAYLNLLFMKGMNFSTIHPLIAYFYNDNNLLDDDFVDACNATAAFYALWRCAQSSSKLDNVARDLMIGNIVLSDGTKVRMDWNSRSQVSIQQYKQALRKILEREGLLNKDQWKSNARNNLTYQNSSVLSRFVLFLTYHDTIADDANPGLALRGKEDTHAFFSPKRWVGENYNSVEHIAPQQPRSSDNSWAKDIYSHEQGNISHTIGNLTLLPKTMNSIVGNLSWGYKHQFYSYLANPSEQGRNELLQLEGREAIKYSKAAKNTLNSTNLYFHYLRPIVQISPANGFWTREIIEKRTEFICSLAYDRLTKWLQD